MVNRVLNYTFDRHDSRDFPLKAVLPNQTVEELLPSSTDLTSLLGEVLDQGSLGACTLHSVSSQLTFLAQKASITEKYFSRLLMYWNGRLLSRYPVTQDTGLTMRSAVKAAAMGIVPETDWPYDVRKFAQRPSVQVFDEAEKCVTYLAVAQELSELRRCLIKSPISFGITLRESFMSQQVAKTGQVPIPSLIEHIEGGHAMLLTGYDSATKRFKVRNSWGTDWGDKGNCYIPQEMILDKNMSGDFWTLTSLNWDPKHVRSLDSLPAAPKLKPTETPIVEWESKHVYHMGDMVTYEGKKYRCILPHGSIDYWSPMSAPVLWQEERQETKLTGSRRD